MRAIRKTALIICYTNLDKDPRVRRQVEALNQDFYVITAGLSATNKEDEFILLKFNGNANAHWRYPWFLRKSISLYLKFKKKLFELAGERGYELEYWDKEIRSIYHRLKKTNPDLIIANDLVPLPLACRLANKFNVSLVFDAHEYYPREFEGNHFWVKHVQPRYQYFCRKYLQKADMITVVSETIGREYKKNFQVNYKVIDNKTAYKPNLKPSEVDEKKIRLVHHGLANRDRGLDQIINAFKLLPGNYELHFILMINAYNRDYYDEIMEKASVSERIFFHDPVPMNEIAAFINQFDVGLNYFHTNNFNILAAIPNKFYEFLQARLAIISGPSFEMHQVIKEYDLGSFTTDSSASSLATTILSLTPPDILRCKYNAHKLAFELSAEANKRLIKEIANQLC